MALSPETQKVIVRSGPSFGDWSLHWKKNVEQLEGLKEGAARMFHGLAEKFCGVKGVREH